LITGEKGAEGMEQRAERKEQGNLNPETCNMQPVGAKREVGSGKHEARS